MVGFEVLLGVGTFQSGRGIVQGMILTLCDAKSNINIHRLVKINMVYAYL